MRIFPLFLISGAVASALAIALAGPCLPGPPGESFPCGLQQLLIIVVSFGLAWTTLQIRQATLRLGVAGVALAEVYLLSWVLATYGIEWEPYPPMIGGALATLMALFYHTTAAGLWRGQSIALFQAKASPETLSRIIEAVPSSPGESREGTSLLLTLPQRATLVATLPAEAYGTLLGTMHRIAAAEIRASGGVIEEAGEAHLRAFFGVVTGATPSEAALQGCRAALLLADRLEQAFTEEKTVFALGVASGTGITTLNEGRFLFSGFPALEAERLAETNATWGTWVLISPETARLVEEKIELRPVEQWEQADGSHREIYELLGMAGQLSEEEAARRDAFWRGLVHHRRGEQAEAKRAWRRADPEGEDPLIIRYQSLLAADQSHLPS